MNLKSFLKNLLPNCFLALLASSLLLYLWLWWNTEYIPNNNDLTVCKGHLEGLGLALEAYSVDHDGTYPGDLLQLVPKYLDSIPTCPAGKSSQYFYVQVSAERSVIKKTAGITHYCFVSCAGDNHKSYGVPLNYPQYDAIQGMIER